MTGYSKASSAAAIGTGDSLNTAIGKLEKALDNKLSITGGNLSGGITVGDTRAYTSVFSDTIELYAPDGSETYIYPGSIELYAAAGAMGTLHVDDDSSLR